MARINILRATLKNYMQYGVCADCSYCIKVHVNDEITEYNLVGKTVRVVSAPYTAKVKSCGRSKRIRLVEFVVVFYEGERYRIVNHFKEITSNK